jgi:hypothetical protein
VIRLGFGWLYWLCPLHHANLVLSELWPCSLFTETVDHWHPTTSPAAPPAGGGHGGKESSDVNRAVMCCVAPLCRCCQHIEVSAAGAVR